MVKKFSSIGAFNDSLLPPLFGAVGVVIIIASLCLFTYNAEEVRFEKATSFINKKNRVLSWSSSSTYFVDQFREIALTTMAGERG